MEKNIHRCILSVRHKKTTIVCYHYYVESKKKQMIETQSRLVVAKNRGEENGYYSKVTIPLDIR